MHYFGNPCEGCAGEDCVCCEVFLEHQADIRCGYSYEDEPSEFDIYFGFVQ